jgi:hypothetical protein
VGGLDPKALASLIKSTPGCDKNEDVVFIACNTAVKGYGGSPPYSEKLSNILRGRLVVGMTNFGWVNSEGLVVGVYPYLKYGGWPNQAPKDDRFKDVSKPGKLQPYLNGKECGCANY